MPRGLQVTIIKDLGGRSSNRGVTISKDPEVTVPKDPEVATPMDPWVTVL